MEGGREGGRGGEEWTRLGDGAFVLKNPWLASVARFLCYIILLFLEKKMGCHLSASVFLRLIWRFLFGCLGGFLSLVFCFRMAGEDWFFV